MSLSKVNSCVSILIVALLCLKESASKRVPPPSPVTIVFPIAGKIQPYVGFSLLQARLSNPEARVVGLLHDDEFGERGVNHSPLNDEMQLDPFMELNTVLPRAVAREYDIEVVMVDWRSDPLHRRFQAAYRHSSVNPYKFDYIAIARFFSLLQLMRGDGASWPSYVHSRTTSPITLALYLDADIMLFSDLTTVMPPGSTMDTYTDYATHWTREKLLSFCEYALDFYERDDASLAGLIHEHGDRSSDLVFGVDNSAEIGSWWPSAALRYVPRHSRVVVAPPQSKDDGHATKKSEATPSLIHNPPRKHFGDMYLFSAFLKERPGILKVVCTSSTPCTDGVAASYMSMADFADCHNVTDVDAAFVRWDEYPDRSLQVPVLRPSTREIAKRKARAAHAPGTALGDNNPQVARGLHFQGDCKSVLPRLLCRNAKALPSCANVG